MQQALRADQRRKFLDWPAECRRTLYGDGTRFDRLLDSSSFVCSMLISNS
jgi:hypothetical protein